MDNRLNEISNTLESIFVAAHYEEFSKCYALLKQFYSDCHIDYIIQQAEKYRFQEKLLERVWKSRDELAKKNLEYKENWSRFKKECEYVDHERGEYAITSSDIADVVLQYDPFDEFIPPESKYYDD